MRDDCDDIEDPENYEWHVEPHANHQYDTFCTNDPVEALNHAIEVLEDSWGALDPGDEFVVKVMRKQI